MRWRASLAVLPLAGILLAGCGGGDHYGQVAKGGHGYSVVKLPWEGRYVFCKKFYDGGGGDSQARWGALSCDFEEFHHKYGYHPHFYDSKASRSGTDTGG